MTVNWWMGSRSGAPGVKELALDGVYVIHCPIEMDMLLGCVPVCLREDIFYMTGQINDLFRYQGRTIALSQSNPGELFDPNDFGMNPVGVCTDCWKGYQATYGLSNSFLVLDALEINLETAPGDGAPLVGPQINGVRPRVSSSRRLDFNNFYQDLSHRLTYTGEVLLVEEFIWSLYVHMGMQPAWKFKKIVGLEFEKGCLMREEDRSKEYAELRRKFMES